MKEFRALSEPMGPQAHCLPSLGHIAMKSDWIEKIFLED